MRNKMVLAVTALVLVGLLAAGVVLAAGETITRSVMGGGGTPVEAGGYALVGTIAEPVATNLDTAAGASYHVSSGFWAGGAVAGGGGGVYLPVLFND